MDSQKLPCVSEPVSCTLLIFLSSYVLTLPSYTLVYSSFPSRLFAPFTFTSTSFSFSYPSLFYFLLTFLSYFPAPKEHFRNDLCFIYMFFLPPPSVLVHRFSDIGSKEPVSNDMAHSDAVQRSIMAGNYKGRWKTAIHVSFIV